MKKIILTGGGTAGHIIPNIALIPYLKKNNYDIYYIGSKYGIEKKIIKNMYIKYYYISTGKLRRYFSIKNFTDLFKIIYGIIKSIQIIKKIKPNIIFSKGGFVSVPIIIASSVMKIPIFIHESDITFGLANKISIPFATKICCNFYKTTNNILINNKTIFTGIPLRKEIFNGNIQIAKKITKLTNNKPIILFIGGSLGAKNINYIVYSILNILLKNFQIIHICGKNNINKSLKNINGYIQYEYINKNLQHIFSLSNIVISRAGANTICELVALKKPNILIPLSKNISRGDQILNANFFKNIGYSIVIQEKNITIKNIINKIYILFMNYNLYIKILSKNKLNNDYSIKKIIKLFEKYYKK